MDPLRLGKKVDKLLDGQQKARFRELAGIEKLLFTKLFAELSSGLEESNGRITSRRGFVSLSKAIDSIFDAVEKAQMKAMARGVVGDMREMLAASSEYYGGLQVLNKTSFLGVKSNVDATMRKRLGIGKGKEVKKNGYLDQLFRAGAARDDVKKMVAKAVAAGIPMRQLEKQLQVKVQGTRSNAGVLEKHIGGFVLDAYQVADSIANNEFGKQLGLKYFVYSGGLIETSRAFCRKRNNKVFTTKEAEGWKNDPTLPRSKAERDSGVVTDYIPLEDRGRWRCRHRLLYISDQMAFRLRPELRSSK